MGHINTKAVTDRRVLHFANFDDLRADLRRIVEAEQAGTLRRTGNWTAAQCINHVAAWMEYPFDGYPGKGPPLLVKLICRLSKKAFFKGSLKPGFVIPGAPGGTFGIEDGPIDLAEARLIKASERLDHNRPAMPNPVFGPLTHDEWKLMNLKHAELHFSFLHPASSPQ